MPRRCLNLSLLGLIAIAAHLHATEAISLAFGVSVHGGSRASSLEIFPQPSEDKLAEAAVACRSNSAVNGGEHLVGLIPLLDSAEMHVGEMSGPASEVIQDMGGVDDGALANLSLALQPAEEFGTAQDIEVNSNLVKEKDSPRSQQTHRQLDAATLAVRHSVHAPVGVNVKHQDKLLATLRVRVAADGGQQLIDTNVGADDGVQDPFEAKVGDALQALFEGIDTADGDGVTGGKALAGEETEECRLACSIRTDKESPRTRRKIQADVADSG